MAERAVWGIIFGQLAMGAIGLMARLCGEAITRCAFPVLACDLSSR